MQLTFSPGTYVVAVSGGVDSMALLHLLHSHRTPQVKLIVAHLDHGTRGDSQDDRRLVQAKAKEYGLPFVYHRLELGPDTSEATARNARYGFLQHVRQNTNARAIITAHHADDVIETAVHNILRGTGRRGISSLRSRHDIERPFLGMTKDSLRAYARDQGLLWREDSTNTDPKYMRNYLRHQVLPRMDSEQKRQLEWHLGKVRELNKEIEKILSLHLHTQPAVHRLDRRAFTRLPHVVSREVMAAWLLNNQVRGFDRRLLERLVRGAKVLPAGKKLNVTGGHYLLIKPAVLELSFGSHHPSSV